MESILRSILYLGGASFVIAMLLLTILQFMLGRRTKRNFFTFLSVVFHPKKELLESEIRIRKAGNWFLVIGILLISISGMALYSFY